jgi:hypothetical protein
VVTFLNQGRQLAIRTNQNVCVHSTSTAMQYRLSNCGGGRPGWGPAQIRRAASTPRRVYHSRPQPTRCSTMSAPPRRLRPIRSRAPQMGIACRSRSRPLAGSRSDREGAAASSGLALTRKNTRSPERSDSRISAMRGTRGREPCEGVREALG